jgi:D-sedoheptulose 7-phosphate isomerase
MDAGLKNLVQSWLQESLEVKQAVVRDEQLIEMLQQASEWCAEACQAGNKVMFMGNGGSAADAQHMAGEFVSRFNYDRPGIGAFALTVDTSVLTAIGNDYGYQHLFARQVQACGRPGDVLVGMSTSGNSPNVLLAFEEARRMGIRTVALTGATGGKMRDATDLCLRVPSTSTPRIQECHILLGHVLCGLVEAIIHPKAE